MLTLHPCSASPHGRGRALSRITRQRPAEDRATLSVRSHQSRCEVRAADKDAEDRQPGGQEGGDQSQGGYGPPVTAWWSSRPTEATGDLLALSRCRKRLKCPSGTGGGGRKWQFPFHVHSVWDRVDVGEGKHSTNLYLIKKSRGFVVEQPHRLFLFSSKGERWQAIPKTRCSLWWQD